MKQIPSPIEDGNDGCVVPDNERLCAAIGESRQLRETLTASAALLRKAMDRYAAAVEDLAPKK